MRGGFVRIGDMLVHHVHGGQGSPPVVFVHGLGSAGYLEWRFNLPVIARSHRVFAPDLPGFGRSEQPHAGYGIPLFAGVIEEYLRLHRLRPVLVGASMGGRVAIEVALRQPDRVRKLVLVNALGVARPTVQPFYPLMLVPRVGEAAVGVVREAMHRLQPSAIRHVARRYLGVPGDIDRIMNESFLVGLREMHATEGYPRAYASTVRSLAMREAYDTEGLLSRLARTGIPVMLVWGEGDRLLPLARARRSHGLLPGARLEVIAGAGHAPQAEQPDEVNRVLQEFI